MKMVVSFLCGQHRLRSLLTETQVPDRSICFNEEGTLKLFCHFVATGLSTLALAGAAGRDLAGRWAIRLSVLIELLEEKAGGS